MLVDRTRRRRVFLLSGLSAALAGLTAASTLADVHVYDNAILPGLLLGTLGFDVMSLGVSVATIACLWALERRHERFWLVWLGLQGYLLYAYAIFTFGLVYTRFYFLYIAITGLSAYALAGFALHFNARTLRHWHESHLPRRTMGIALFAIAAVFTFGWVTMLAEAIAAGSDIPGAIVLALDLAFVLPLLVVVGTSLYQRRALGDFLAPGAFAMSAAITLAVAVGEALRPFFGGAFSPILAAPYLVPGAVSLAFAVLAFRRVGSSLSQLGI
jgi:hypothetical protein